MAEHENCECLFCNSKCPECGATDIHVKYVIEYGYDNIVEDEITVSQSIAGVYLKCESCGERMADSTDFWDDEYEFHVNEPEDRLESLTKALLGVYPGVKKLTYAGEGKINIEDYNLEVTHTKIITCPHCGKRTLQNSLKCHRCGKEIKRR